MTETHIEQVAPKKSGIWKVILLAMLATMIITVIITLLCVKYFFFASPFKAVELNQKEERVLTEKLELIGMDGIVDSPSSEGVDVSALEPEAYSEKDAKREVRFSEKEVNALIAKNTDLADKLAIDLSDDLISAKYLLPMDEDVPFFGGKTLRIKAGVEVAYAESKPRVVLKGVSVMGVTVPNAWLGNLKNVDLIEEYGEQTGFWKSFSDGVDHILIDDGRLEIKLKE